MLKIFLGLIIAVIFCFDNSFAQLRLGLSGGYALPTGDFGTINKNGWGGSASAKYSLSDRFALTSNLSFYAFGRGGEDIGRFAEALGLSATTAALLNAINATSPNKIKIPKVNFFPINIGFEYYLLTDKIRPYLGLDVGMYVRNTEDVTLNLAQLITQYYTTIGQPVPVGLQPLIAVLNTSQLALNGNDANFGIAPVLGCYYQLNEKLNLDFNFKANSVFVPEKKSAALVLGFNLGLFYSLGN
jgi:hypothetical protein